MNKKLLMILVLILALVTSTQSVFAVYCGGGFPHFFSGTLKINNEDAPVDTQVRGLINGEVKGTYTTKTVGQYGLLAISGDGSGYDAAPTINFEVYIDGQWIDSGETALYVCGDSTTLNIDAEYQAQTDSDGDGVPDDQDVCEGYDDNVDTDADGTPDGCDACTDVDEDSYCAEVDDCDDDNANINPVADDSDCDNVDDDCDQTADDDYASVPTQCGVGACYAEGSTSCVAGSIEDSCTEGVPAADDATCDNVDDDCDGTADEDYASDEGCFLPGVCSAFNVGSSCTAGVETACSTGTPAEEVCDEADNDCDGLTDEDDVCQQEPTDTDGDGVPDSEDNCVNDQNPNQEDADNDGIGDSCDACTDVDLDGFCAEADDCDDNNAAINPDATEVCDEADNDCDGLTDEDDICAAPDSDGDGVPDDQDVCEGYDDNVDTDADGIPDGCDNCPNDADNDADQDGVCGDADICPGSDDNVDTDADGIPDGCDNCPNDSDKTEPGVCGCGIADTDSDDDDVADCIDVCAGYDDNVDSDSDGTPDGCDDDVTLYQVSIEIYDGWTLFALPFNPAVIGIDNSEELGQAIMNDTGVSCDVMKRFNGATQLMESDVLDFGDASWDLSGTEGYFISCEGSATFTYEGTLWV